MIRQKRITGLRSGYCDRRRRCSVLEFPHRRIPAVRNATLSFFRSLSDDAWMRRGIASGNPFTVHAVAYIAAGYVNHHVRILRERYL